MKVKVANTRRKHNGIKIWKGKWYIFVLWQISWETRHSFALSRKSRIRQKFGKIRNLVGTWSRPGIFSCDWGYSRHKDFLPANFRVWASCDLLNSNSFRILNFSYQHSNVSSFSFASTFIDIIRKKKDNKLWFDSLRYVLRIWFFWNIWNTFSFEVSSFL